jgi:hypothetical protein
VRSIVAAAICVAFGALVGLASSHVLWPRPPDGYRSGTCDHERELVALRGECREWRQRCEALRQDSGRTGSVSSREERGGGPGAVAESETTRLRMLLSPATELETQGVEALASFERIADWHIPEAILNELWSKWKEQARLRQLEELLRPSNVAGRKALQMIVDREGEYRVRLPRAAIMEFWPHVLQYAEDLLALEDEERAASDLAKIMDVGNRISRRRLRFEREARRFLPPQYCEALGFIESR